MPRLTKRAISLRECEALAEHWVKLSHIHIVEVTIIIALFLGYQSDFVKKNVLIF